MPSGLSGTDPLNHRIVWPVADLATLSSQIVSVELRHRPVIDGDVGRRRGAFSAYGATHGKRHRSRSHATGGPLVFPFRCIDRLGCASALLQLLPDFDLLPFAKDHPNFDRSKEKWMIGIMTVVTIVKFGRMLYCRIFKNEIVKAYAQDHFFDVITNSIGLVTAILAARLKWWIDPVGAILIAVYTICTWAKTVLENVWTLIGKTAPPDYLAKLTYLIWNHHEEIKHIDTVRAYTFGSHYFVEVDIVLPGNMLLSQAHDIGEALQEKLEQLPEVERAFVHVDFEYTHRPEHKTKL